MLVRKWLLRSVIVALMLALSLGPLRASPECRFGGRGALLSAVPLAASASGDRLLLPVGLGASALCAHVIAHLAQRLSTVRLAAPALLGLVLIHLVLAPLALPIRVDGVGQLARLARRLERAMPLTPEVQQKTVVVVNAPADVLLSYAQLARAARREPRPKHLYWLATASSPLQVQRVSKTTLRLVPREGFLFSPPERHYRARWLPLQQGERVELSQMTAIVRERTNDGRPQSVDFEFNRPLEDRSYHFMIYRDGTLVPWRLPAVGAARRFPAQHLLGEMFPGPRSASGRVVAQQ